LHSISTDGYQDISVDGVEFESTNSENAQEISEYKSTNFDECVCEQNMSESDVSFDTFFSGSESDSVLSDSVFKPSPKKQCIETMC